MSRRQTVAANDTWDDRPGPRAAVTLRAGASGWNRGATIGLVLVVGLAAVVRLAFALRPPPFLTPDSQGYFLPGWELANGFGFMPELRRTPGYPLFIGLAVFVLGDDLRGLVLAQHCLGVLTTGLAYALGRLAYGWLAGLLGGLAVATAGPLLIYEHYVLTEPLFTFLLTLAFFLGFLALTLPTRGPLLASGLALAAAALTRPVADVLLPLLPLALFVRLADWRRALPASGWYLLGVCLLLLPWMGRNAVVHGAFSPEGALGQALIGRTVRHDDYRKFYACPPESSASAAQHQALLIICEEVATGEPSGGTITQRVRDELGLSQAATSNLLRQIALDAIARRPGYFLTGSLEMTGEVLVGKRETVIAPWRDRTTRNWDSKWDPRLTALVKNPPPAEGPDYERADALASSFQPFRWRGQIGLLLVIGLLATAALPSWRPALLLPLGAAAIVLASAALDGNVWRYRYPVDPLLAVVAGGGAQALWAVGQRAWVGWRRRPARRVVAGGEAAASHGQAGEGPLAEHSPVVERGL